MKGLRSTPAPAELQTLFRLPDPAKEASEATEGVAEGAKATGTMDKVTTKAAPGAFKTEMTDLFHLCTDFLNKAGKIVFLKQRRAELTALAKFP